MDETHLTQIEDPRTVIAQRLSKHWNNELLVAVITVALAEDLAYWLSMKAGSFAPFDERTPGYSELATRFTNR